ncbi:MAG: protein-disulfide reductase DsbD domain-containing protein [Pseudomonadota bacterium]
MLMSKAVFTAISLALATPAFAQQFGTPATGEILPGWRESNGQHIAGLSIELAPGWKTYWRSPGEGGIPPRFNWSGSQNLANVEVSYPVPEVSVQNGMTSIGYDRDVVLPLTVRAQDSSKPVELHGEIHIGVCEEICIPMTLSVSAMLPEVGAHNSVIARELASQPRAGGRFACVIEPISDGLRLEARATVKPMPGETVIVESGDAGTWVSPPVLSRDGQRLTASVEMVPPSAQPFALARSDVRMTVIGQGGAVEFVGC